MIRGIQAAVTRKPWGDEPDQSYSLTEAIEAYTVEGAYAEFKEDRKGRIKPGFFADLVILNGDIEAIAAEKLHALHPVQQSAREGQLFPSDKILKA